MQKRLSIGIMTLNCFLCFKLFLLCVNMTQSCPSENPFRVVKTKLLGYWHSFVQCPLNLISVSIGTVLLLGSFIPAWYYSVRPVPMQQGNITMMVSSGDTARTVAANIRKAGVDINETVFLLSMRMRGNANGIHMGRYSFSRGSTLSDLVTRLSSGSVDQIHVRISDGINIRDLRALIANTPHIDAKTTSMTDAELLKAVGATEKHPEGLFAPETYHFTVGTSDITFLKIAYERQKALLEKYWAERSPNLKLRTPYQALILASLIEKETGLHTDRYLVSSVFHNRLKIWMPLQTDPTIIYAMGENFKGKIRKRDLQINSPYNTYLNYGLPPTPIAMPSEASIRAAVHPAKTNYLYFVARGDGTTKFSNKLIDHNEAVVVYQKKKKKGQNK